MATSSVACFGQEDQMALLISSMKNLVSFVNTSKQTILQINYMQVIYIFIRYFLIY